LPEPKITSNDIDRDTIDFPIEDNNIVNGISTEDEAKMEEEAKAEMERAVKKNGTLQRATKELKKTMSDYLTALYGGDVKIKFTSVE
jgi:spermidine/putrescine-binding protein